MPFTLNFGRKDKCSAGATSVEFQHGGQTPPGMLVIDLQETEAAGYAGTSPYFNANERDQ